MVSKACYGPYRCLLVFFLFDEIWDSVFNCLFFVCVELQKVSDHKTMTLVLERKSKISDAGSSSGEMRDYYDVLGVPVSASPEVIRKAYRQLQKIHHPDVAGSEVCYYLRCRIDNIPVQDLSKSEKHRLSIPQFGFSWAAVVDLFYLHLSIW